MALLGTHAQCLIGQHGRAARGALALLGLELVVGRDAAQSGSLSGPLIEPRFQLEDLAAQTPADVELEAQIGRADAGVAA